ncbi:unnamed protein product [Somion occarium]|uniref:Cyclase n=1 Tax=Somion occarium TaxID=3059160 RepID=A0ABP1DWB5_9APHY
MDIVDLTHTLDENIQIYPGDPQFSCCPALTVENDGWNVQSISLGSHTGTHIDAPYHILKDGQTIETIPISRFIGPCIVIDVTGKQPRERIHWEALASYEFKMRRGAPHGAVVLLRTDWSKYWGNPRYFDHPFLDREAAQKILDTGINVIGIDTLSPDETHVDDKHDCNIDVGVHQTVLGAGGLIAENLTNLDIIQEGSWTINLVPLKLHHCDGSPIRAFASRNVT